MLLRKSGGSSRVCRPEQVTSQAAAEVRPTGLIAQNEGHLHHHSVFHNLAILVFHFRILYPGAFDIVEGFVGPGDAQGDSILQVL